MTPREQPLISVAGLGKTFGTTVALDAVTFSVARGEMFGVIGPDGAGKTTVLRMLCGLIRPDAGAVSVSGVDPYRSRRHATTVIGYLSQKFSLYGDLSIDENIEFFARLHGVNDFEARRRRLLDLTGLTPFRERLAEKLSGGMKQKLALACTLVHEPELLLLDEPTTGVDPVSRREFWKLLAEFLAEGRTIVVATPYLDEAERCSRVALVHQGRILALDDPAELQRTEAGQIFEVVVDQPRAALSALRRVIGNERIQLFGDRLHVQAGGAMAADTIATTLREAGHEPLGVRPIMPSLEDVFIARLAAAAAAPAQGASTPHGDKS